MGNPPKIQKDDPPRCDDPAKGAMDKQHKKKKKKDKKSKKDGEPQSTQKEKSPPGGGSRPPESSQSFIDSKTAATTTAASKDTNHAPTTFHTDTKKNVLADNSSPEILQTPLPRSHHPFAVDDSDHCETPLRAYQDLAVLLDQLLVEKLGNNSKNNNSKNNNSKNKTPRKPRSSLRIYDPYYCDGGVKTKLASLGFTNVFNENRDFYKDIETGQIPEHDVLVTNPPYSGHHMEKLLDYCVSQSKNNNNSKRPSFLLLPHFVYTKDYYARALSAASALNFFWFLVPSMRYSYVPPEWVYEKAGASKALARGKDTTAPFPSFWYCHGRTISSEWLTQTFGPSGSLRSKHRSGLRYAATPQAIPREFKGEFDPTKKRPNPRARKRMRLAAKGLAPQQQTQQQQPQQPQKKRQRQRDPKKKKKKRY